MYLNQKIKTRKKKKKTISDTDVVTQKVIIESINRGNYVVDVQNITSLDPTYSSSSSSNSYNLKPSKEKNTGVKSNTSKHVSEEIELWSSVARVATTSSVTRDEEAARKSWIQSFQKNMG